MNKYSSFMHMVLIVLVTVTLGSKAYANPLLTPLEKALQDGDLLFVNLDCGKLCDAIEDVTLRQFHTNEPSLSHVAISFYDKKMKSWFVFEAWDGVEKTPLSTFLDRTKATKETLWVKRAALKKRETKRIKKWIENRVGVAYDEAFILHNNAYYCSELITDAFQAVQKEPIFGYLPMYFGDVGNPKDKSASIWIAYFKEKNLKIPQNEPGASPLSLFLNAALETVPY
ncbi:MAG: hypothetical protein KDD46_02180 [Bdellovibrionales bacterium]|nr:hypothetical protein [Bdellovibrionales bacterium]